MKLAASVDRLSRRCYPSADSFSIYRHTRNPSGIPIQDSERGTIPLSDTIIRFLAMLLLDANVASLGYVPGMVC